MMKKELRKILGVLIGIVVSVILFFENTITVPDLEGQIDFHYDENGEYCYNIENLDELISK